MTTLDTIVFGDNFDTSKITSMNRMFYGMESLKTLDISTFNTLNVTDMRYIFNNMINLETIYVSENWNTDNVSYDTDMFKMDEKIVGGSGTTYSSSHTGDKYARIDCPGVPGYFTYKGPLGDNANYCYSRTPM